MVPWVGLEAWARCFPLPSRFRYTNKKLQATEPSSSTVLTDHETIFPVF